MKLYIAGPMSGKPQFNYPAFHTAANLLRDAGYIVRNPAEHDPPVCGTWNGWIKLAIPAMLSCEAVAVLGGWEDSRGAMLEVYIARELDMPIRTWKAWLADAPRKP